MKDEYTQKDIFEVVKYFKFVYTLINNNNVEKIYFKGNKFYYKKDTFFILYGELENNADNAFLEWIINKEVTLELDYINIFKNDVIKKNIQTLESTDDYFKITYEDRDGENKEFLCSNKVDISYANIVQAVDIIKPKLGHDYDLDFTKFEDTLLLYIDENQEISMEFMTETLIDFPIKRILSTQSLSKALKKFLKFDEATDKIEYVLQYSDRDEYGKRFIEISSKSKLMQINQIFATI